MKVSINNERKLTLIAETKRESETLLKIKSESGKYKIRIGALRVNGVMDSICIPIGFFEGFGKL